MALINRAVRSGRILTKISEITRPKKVGATKVQVPIIVKMKRSHARLLGQTQIQSNDEALYGTFGGAGTNSGKRFLKNIGGYRSSSFKFVGEKPWDIQETKVNLDGTTTTTTVQVKSISIGFPGGVASHEVIAWVNSKNSTFRNNLLAIITPNGRRFAYTDASEVAP